MDTIEGLALGTSIPIVPFPGIGAMMRIPRAASDNAISSSRLRIFDILTPSAGVISYRVIVGPTVALISRICTPKEFKTSTMRCLFAMSSSLSIYGFLSLSYFFSKERGGKL